METIKKFEVKKLNPHCYNAVTRLKRLKRLPVEQFLNFFTRLSRLGSLFVEHRFYKRVPHQKIKFYFVPW